ncbi:agmatine deiminase family protein [Leucobacter sp.]
MISAPRWVAPAETAPHERLWMAFPAEGATDRAVAAWSAVANAAVGFEPVTMLVSEGQRGAARRSLSGDIDLVTVPHDDAWLRDSGPTFVLDAAGGLGAVDWIFNGWGARSWATWDLDAEIASFVAEQAGATAVTSPLVNEGGGILVDGLGTVIVTETVQRDPFRNPYADRKRVEAELRRTVGAEHVIWLPRGLTADYVGYGTRGHVDMVAAIPAPGTLLLHRQTDPSHPDFEVSRLLERVLSAETDARGASWDIRPLPAPERLTDGDGWVDWNYANHAVVNGGVISCAFDDPADAAALEILRDAYPDREVLAVDARAIFEHGGGIHCITQQQPAAGAMAA